MQHDDNGRFDRAVSPVIGVILMVAITVILAAVIGAFVLEIGDQQETAPSTSFDSEQQEQYYCAVPGSGCSWSRANLTTVDIAHAGGSTVDIDSVAVKVNGNESTYGSIVPTDYNINHPEFYPVPDFVPTLGSNEQVSFSSGETWSMHSASAGEDFDGFSHEHFEKAINNGDCNPQAHFNNGDPERMFLHNGASWGGSCPYSGNKAFQPLDQGDNINVVWTASSGGKTQTLFKYTVQ